MSNPVNDILDSETYVSEADQVLEPYQLTFALGSAYQNESFDSDAVYPNSDRLHVLKNHLDRVELSQQNSLEIGDNTICIPELMVETTRMPYKLTANTFNCLREKFTEQEPDLPMQSPERIADYMETETEVEIANFSSAAVLGLYSTFQVGSINGYAGALTAFAAAGWMTNLGRLDGEEGIYSSVQEDLDQIYEDLTTDFSDHVIEPV